jgi:hypothetical protein
LPQTTLFSDRWLTVPTHQRSRQYILPHLYDTVALDSSTPEVTLPIADGSTGCHSEAGRPTLDSWRIRFSTSQGGTSQGNAMVQDLCMHTKRSPSRAASEQQQQNARCELQVTCAYLAWERPASQDAFQQDSNNDNNKAVSCRTHNRCAWANATIRQTKPLRGGSSNKNAMRWVHLCMLVSGNLRSQVSSKTVTNIVARQWLQQHSCGFAEPPVRVGENATIRPRQQVLSSLL